MRKTSGVKYPDISAGSRIGCRKNRSLRWVWPRLAQRVFPGPDTVSAMFAGRHAPLPRQRELLRSRAVAALLHRRARASRRRPHRTRDRAARAPRSDSTAPAGTRRSCSGHARLRRRRDRPAPVARAHARRHAARAARRDRVPAARRAGSRSRRRDRRSRARSAARSGANRWCTRVGAGGEIRIVLVNDPDGTAIELDREAGHEGGARSRSSRSRAPTSSRPAPSTPRSASARSARYPSENADGAHLHIDGPVAMDEIVADRARRRRRAVHARRLPRHRGANPALHAPANTLGMWRVRVPRRRPRRGGRGAARRRIDTISAAGRRWRWVPACRRCASSASAGPTTRSLELIEQPS